MFELTEYSSKCVYIFQSLFFCCLKWMFGKYIWMKNKWLICKREDLFLNQVLMSSMNQNYEPRFSSYCVLNLVYVTLKIRQTSSRIKSEDSQEVIREYICVIKVSIKKQCTKLMKKKLDNYWIQEFFPNQKWWNMQKEAGNL